MSLENWVGLGLLLLGIVLYFGDVGFDIGVDLTLSGIDMDAVDVMGICAGICVTFGAFLLFGDWRIGLGVLAVASALVTARMVVRYRAIKGAAEYPDEVQMLVGQTGYTSTALEPRGTVQMASELWSAISDSGQSIEKGTEVMVVDVDGLTLKVFKITETSIEEEK